MGKRKDGRETKARLLKTACQVFSEKGFRDATVAEISHRSDANIAAINYHFGDKEHLYVEAWRSVCQEAMALYPFTEDAPNQAIIKERLRGHILTLLNRMSDTSRLGMMHRMMMMELSNPTGLIDNVLREMMSPMRDNMQSLIRELLGPKATDADVLFCEVSVITQCRGMGFKKRNVPDLFDFTHVREASTETLADHITAFSLAGIKAIRTEIEHRLPQPASADALSIATDKM